MGNERLLLGITGVFGFFGMCFVLLGGFRTPWVGGPRRGFRKYLRVCAMLQAAPLLGCPTGVGGIGEFDFFLLFF